MLGFCENAIDEAVAKTVQRLLYPTYINDVIANTEDQTVISPEKHSLERYPLGSHPLYGAMKTAEDGLADEEVANIKLYNLWYTSNRSHSLESEAMSSVTLEAN